MVARIPTTVHNGTTYMSSRDIISDNVIGLGSYIVISPTPMTFLHSVGSGQTIDLNGLIGSGKSELYLADPIHFQGRVDMTAGFIPKAPPGFEQVAVGMSMVSRAVDSYSYHNDMLSLWYHNHIVQQLRLTVHDPYGITVQASPGAEIWVSANIPHLPGNSDPANIQATMTKGISFLNSPPSAYPGMPVHV